MALSDPLGILATPLTIITRTDEEADVKNIIAIIQNNQVGRIIAGLPLSMDGSLSAQAEKVKSFVAVLCRHSHVPLVFRDERLSTVAAKRTVRDVRKTSKGARYDAVAAALVLQGYLDSISFAED